MNRRARLSLAPVLLATVACSPSGASPSAATGSAIPQASESATNWGAFVTAAIELGEEAGAVATSKESVWVAPHLSSAILRIDPEANTVVQTTNLPGGGPPAELDADGELVWASVSSPTYSLDHLVGIDAADGEILATAPVPGGFPKIGGDFVWAAGADGLFKIERTTGRLASTIDLQGCWPVATPAWTWCSTGEHGYVVDARTDAVAEVEAGLAFGPAVEVVGSVVWGISPRGDSVWGFDVDTDSIVATLPAPEGVAEYLPDAAILNGTIWNVARDGPSWYVVPIGVTTLTVGEPIAIAEPEFGIAAGFGALWIPVLREPVVLRLEPPG